MAPRSATKAAPAGGAAAKVRSDPMRQLSETEGVLEEGKIFFLYRCRSDQGRACTSFSHALSPCPVTVQAWADLLFLQMFG